MSSLPFLSVVCALMRDANGLILLTQRRADAPLAQLWEFAGGKVEPGESHAQALARELREELGIEAQMGAELARVIYDYPQLRVELILLEVTQWQGELQPLQVAAMRWEHESFIRQNYHLMPPADEPLFEAYLQARAPSLFNP